MDEFDLSLNKKKISKSKIRQLTLLSICYVFLIFFIAFISQFEISITLFSYELSPSVLSGILTSFCVAIGILMTETHWYFGGICSFTFFFLSFVICILSITYYKHIGSIPGLFFLFSGYIINSVLFEDLKKLQNKNLITMKLSATDPVTGLYNRRGITNYIESLIAMEKKFYVLYLDLDNFKKLNDSFGHKAGDAALCEIGKRWKRIPKPDGRIARNGGDEYIIVITHDIAFDIEGYTAECVKKAAEPIIVNDKGETFLTSASIGVSQYGKNGKTLDEILNKADSAMYESKHKGKNCFTIA